MLPLSLFLSARCFHPSICHSKACPWAANHTNTYFLLVQRDLGSCSQGRSVENGLFGSGTPSSLSVQSCKRFQLLASPFLPCVPGILLNLCCCCCTSRVLSAEALLSPCLCRSSHLLDGFAEGGKTSLKMAKRESDWGWGAGDTSQV